MVFNSQWTGISCAWSLRATSPFGSSWLASRYSFRNHSFTKLASWWHIVMHHSTLCLKALWNSYQESLCDPRFRSIFCETSACQLPLAFSTILCRTLEIWVELLTPPWNFSWAHLSWLRMARTLSPFSSRPRFR